VSELVADPGLARGGERRAQGCGQTRESPVREGPATEPQEPLFLPGHVVLAADVAQNVGRDASLACGVLVLF
jgi:hypothetical protein